MSVRFDGRHRKSQPAHSEILFSHIGLERISKVLLWLCGSLVEGVDGLRGNIHPLAGGVLSGKFPTRGHGCSSNGQWIAVRRDRRLFRNPMNAPKPAQQDG